MRDGNLGFPMVLYNRFHIPEIHHLGTQPTILNQSINQKMVKDRAKKRIEKGRASGNVGQEEYKIQIENDLYRVGGAPYPSRGRRPTSFCLLSISRPKGQLVLSGTISPSSGEVEARACLMT